MEKKIGKLIIFIILASSIINYSNVYAGFADYSDEDARKATEILIQEQEQNYSAEKSGNNYLKNLKVNNYEITPEFDKQIVNYEIKEEVTEDEIQVQAETDDEKATISGNGKIALNSGENNITIEVTAENGTVRSYYIKVVKAIKKELRLESMNLVAISNENEVNDIELEPKFNSEIFTYNCNVENYIDKINVDAKANNENTNIEISGNENLKDGLNEVLVTVKIDDNEKTIYRLYVNRNKKEEIKQEQEEKKNYTIIIIPIIIVAIVVIFIIVKRK